MGIKTILFVVLLLFAVSASADDFLDSLDEQTVFVKQSLGLSSASTGRADSTIHKFIREGYIILGNMVDGVEVSDTITTVTGQLDYDIDSIMTRVETVYWHSSDSIKMMVLITPENLQSIYRSGHTLRGKVGFLALPSYFSWKNGQFKLYPPPIIAGDKIYIEGRGRVDNIMTDTAFVADFPINYRTIPVTYAIWKTAISMSMTSKAQEAWRSLGFQIEAIGLNIDAFKKK